MDIRTDSTARELPKPIDGTWYRLLALLAPPEEFAQVDASWRPGDRGYAEYKKMLPRNSMATDELLLL